MLSDQERLISTVNKLVLALNAQALDPSLTLTATAMFVATVLAATGVERKDFDPMLQSAVLMRATALGQV